MADPDAADPLADVRARHRATWTVTGPKRKVCAWANCHGEWPCETARVLAALDAERAEKVAVHKTAEVVVAEWQHIKREFQMRAERAEAAIARARSVGPRRSSPAVDGARFQDEREVQTYRDGWNDALSAIAAALETETP